MYETLDCLVKLFELVGIPVAIGLFYVTKRQERLDREYGTYDALDEKYIDYLKLCCDNPDLDVADIPKPGAGAPDADQRHRELIIFSVLMAIMERAFVMYRDKSGAVRERQWRGWADYIDDWCTRPNFREAWPSLGAQFDADFIGYLETRIAVATP